MLRLRFIILLSIVLLLAAGPLVAANDDCTPIHGIIDHDLTGRFCILTDGTNLIGRNWPTLTGQLIIAANNVTVSGFVFTDPAEAVPGPLLQIGHKSLRPAGNIAIDANIFTDSGHHGIVMLGGVSDARITNNVFKQFYFGRNLCDPQQPPSGDCVRGFVHHIYSQGPTLISGNRFYGRACDHNCFAIHAFTRQQTEITAVVADNDIIGGNVVIGGNAGVAAGGVFANNRMIGGNGERLIIGWRTRSTAAVTGNQLTDISTELNPADTLVFAANRLDGGKLQVTRPDAGYITANVFVGAEAPPLGPLDTNTP